MVEKLTFTFSGNSSGGHCCVTKRHILEWPYIIPSTRCTCVMIMRVNQLLDMPHMSGGWIILAKEKLSQTGM